jgi:hypothetical protein
MGTRYPTETRRLRVWVQISTRSYVYIYEFLLVAFLLADG